VARSGRSAGEEALAEFLVPWRESDKVEGAVERMLGSIDRLTRHILDRMGGFDIDGWHLRSEVSL
jgi:hypothetical protein